MLDRDCRRGRCDQLRMRVYPTLKLGQVGRHVAGPGREYEAQISGIKTTGLAHSVLAWSGLSARRSRRMRTAGPNRVCARPISLKPTRS